MVTEPEREEQHEDLLDRVQAAVTPLIPGASAGARVREALARRRRRQRVRIGAAAAAVVAVGAAGLVVVPGLLGEDAAVTPADRGETDDASTAPAIIQGGGYRPAGFFRDVVGGTAMPSVVRYYRTTPGIIFTARFDWSPDPAGISYLGDLSLERYRSDAARRCSRFVDGGATCVTRDDGTVVGRYEVPADGAFLAPVSEEGPLRLGGSAGVLRGVTAFRPDGRAVTALICTCSSPDGDVLTQAPPITFEVLEDVVTDDSWGLRVGG